VTPRRKETTGERATVIGRVARARVDGGTKSDRLAPGLETAEGDFVVVHVASDTPFVEETLTALEGRRVQTEGVWRNGTLRVERTDLIVLSEDADASPAPAPPNAEGADTSAAPAPPDAEDGQ
jgi:hypothetical protein